MDQAVWEVIAGVAVVALLTLARTSWRQGRNTAHMLEDWRGVPDRPGVPGRPGVMERLAAGDSHFQLIDTRLEDMAQQITNVQSTVDRELPRNGVPAALKLDALYQHFIINGGAGPAAGTHTVIVHPAGAPNEQ